EPGEHLVDARLRVQPEGLVVELPPLDLDEPRDEGRRGPGLEPRLDRPVLLGDEGPDLALALRDDADGDRLHAARGEPAAHLRPEERRELVADEPVEDAPRLLRLETVPVEPAGVPQGFEHRLLRDLVEQDSVHVLPLRTELLCDVPGDRLALAVGVGGEVHVLLVLGRLLDLVEDLRLALDHVVLGGEVVLDVDAELRLRQIHHVPDGRLHLVVLPQVLAEGLRLGRRLDDDEVLGHGSRRGPSAHAACRQNRLPGSWRTSPRSSSARSVSSAAAAGSAARRMTSSTCPPCGPTAPRTRRSIGASAASASAARAATRRAPSAGATAPRTSSADVTSVAPSWIRRCDPRWDAASAGPGTANTSRPCSSAQRAVMSEPLRSAASTTTVASVIPLIRRLRRGKWKARGGAPHGSSLTSAPRAAIVAVSSRCHDG